MERGRIVIVSGPSGAGKTSVVRELVRRCGLPLELSVSATTRPPRQGERDGEAYHFLSAEEFERRREAGEFLECFEVYGRGYWYGTLREEVEQRLAEGRWVVLEIDVHGMLEVVAKYPAAITLFVRPTSLADLRERLERRGTEDDVARRRRLEVAKQEWDHANRYQHQLINSADRLNETVEQACAILRAYQDETPCSNR